MPKVAVIFADGCEEIEGLSVVDVLRRLQVSCDMVGLDNIHVMGAHDIALTCDKVVGDDLLTYDMVVLPGGSGGAQRLRDSAQLQHLMQTRSEAGQWNAAMCAAPIALARYGLLTDTTFTMYPGMKDDIASETPGARFSEDMVIVDQDHKILTSRGPATALAFAFGIAEVLGVDPAPQKEAMLWNYLFTRKH